MEWYCTGFKDDIYMRKERIDIRLTGGRKKSLEIIYDDHLITYT